MTQSDKYWLWKYNKIYRITSLIHLLQVTVTYPGICLLPQMSAISVLWTVLSVLFTGLWSIAVISPFWFENVPNPDPLSSDNSSFAAFGILRFCSKKDVQSVFEMDEWRDFKTCAFYKSFQAIPSLFWQFSIIFYGVGFVMSLCAVILAHITCCHKSICGRSVFGMAGVFQIISGKHVFRILRMVDMTLL